MLRAGGDERFTRAGGKERRRESAVRSAASRRSSTSAKIFTPSSVFFKRPFSSKRFRRDLHAYVPGRELIQIDDREARAEMSDIASLLRIAALMRQTARPWRLSAFERGPLAAAGTNGLTFAAFAAGFHHARTVTATDALTLRTAAGCGRECAEVRSFFLPCSLCYPERSRYHPEGRIRRRRFP